MEPRPKTPILDRQGRLLFAVMVILGYIVTFAFNAILQKRIPIEELFLGILLGVIYLLLGLNERVVFDRLPAGWAGLLFFSVQCSLVFGIGYLLGIGNFVLGLPLVGFAADRLKPWPLPSFCPLDCAMIRGRARSSVALVSAPRSSFWPCLPICD